MSATELSLKLFNAVESKGKHRKPELILEYGLFVEPRARWAMTEINEFAVKHMIDRKTLNKTFHNSWDKISNSSRLELLIDQICHYLSTYGSSDKENVYFPLERLEIPEVSGELRLKTIKALSKNHINKKCLDMLASGIAMSKETVEDVLTLLSMNNYNWTGGEVVKNKEAMVMLADLYGVFPNNPDDALRYVVYKITKDTLFVKNTQTVSSIIGASEFDIKPVFEHVGLSEMSKIFNRNKKIFMALKKNSKKLNATTINKISKLSKYHHEPMPENPLNSVLKYDFTTGEYDHWLDNATPFALNRALSYLYATNSRDGKSPEYCTYRIRNGKSWVKYDGRMHDSEHVSRNFMYLLQYMKSRMGHMFKGKTFYIPDNVEYPLPVSEKNFVGSVPTFTKFLGKNIMAGVYWENAGGATDIDISGLNVTGKVGWNSSYKQGHGSLMYSGDITYAPDGAVEYLRAEGTVSPSLVMSSVFSGDSDCDYRIVVGESEDDLGVDYMMDINNLIYHANVSSVQKQTIIGLIEPQDNGLTSFTVMNLGSGNISVSGYHGSSTYFLSALCSQAESVMPLRELISRLGGNFVDNAEDADVSLSLQDIEKSTFVELFG